MSNITDRRVSALLQLAERCEKAVGADRELDGIIDRLLHDRPNDGDYHAGENCIWRVDDDSGLCVRGDGFARGSFCAASYTASLDAAMLLVPEGWSLIGIEQIRTDEAPEVRLMERWGEGYIGTQRGSGNTTWALAICAAALRARAAS